MECPPDAGQSESDVRTLIVEDSATLCAIYTQYLDGLGLEVSAVETLAEARAALEAVQPELILLDIELPDGNGMDLMDTVGDLPAAPAVVVMTGHGSDYAEQAMSRGATDFLNKPFDAARLRVTLLNAAEKQALTQRLEALSHQRDRLGSLRGQSPAMQMVYATVESLAGSLATAFVMGESGTGKELAARAIHQMSARAPGPFVTVDCAALGSDRLEYELFGVRSETGETLREGLVARATQGTLFLDEVCSLSFEAQSALLRLIQYGIYRPVGSSAELAADVRIVASTNRDPLFEMREGRLREDLYYRLHVVPLRMPPLRERADDVLALAESFLTQFAVEEGKPELSLDDRAKRALTGYSWPGNVRQLENAMRQLVLTTAGSDISDTAIFGIISDTEAHGEGVDPALAGAGYVPDPSGVEPLWLIEKKAIESAITACDGNINRASQLLQVAPSTIYRKIQSWKEQTQAES